MEFSYSDGQAFTSLMHDPECLANDLSPTPELDLVRHSIEGGGKSHDVFSKQETSVTNMNKRVKVDISQWDVCGSSASFTSAAPTSNSSQTVLSTVTQRLCDPSQLLPSNEQIITHKDLSPSYPAIEKMLSWFWKLYPAYDQEVAKTRGLLLDEIERHWRALQEAPRVHGDAGITSHFEEMVSQARTNANRKEVKKEPVKKMKFSMGKKK